MGKNKNGKQKQMLEEVPELDEGEEFYDYSAEEGSDGYPGLADMLGEDNWANAAVAGQPDPWSVHKTVQQNAGGSQWGHANANHWGSTIPTPAQLAAHNAAAAAAASGSKGGKQGKQQGNYQQQQKGDKKGGGKGAAPSQQAWETWGMDPRPQAAEAWGNDGDWGVGSGWGAGANDPNDWGTRPNERRREPAQPSKHAQGHWTTWGEEAKRLPKVTSVPQSHVGVNGRPDLAAQQHSEILQALLNHHHPLQGHDVRATYEQQKDGWGQQKGGSDGWSRQQKGGSDGWGQQKGGHDAWGQQKGGHDAWGQQKGGHDAWGQQKGGQDGWGQQKGGQDGWGQEKGGQWDAWGQYEQQPGEQQQKGGKKNKQNKQENQQGNKQDKKNKKNQQQQQQNQKKQKNQQQTDPWGTEGWDDGGWGMPEEEDDYSDYDEMGRRVHFTPITSNLWGGSEHESTYKMPSKTLAHAYKGTTTSLFTGAPRNKVSEGANVHFIDSKGAALLPVNQALFGKTRMAKDRIHWMFPPNKDDRVASLLAWIELMSYNLGAYGLHRFLQSRERGALIANADFRPPNSPNEPAFDWLTFDQLQATRDRVLQESVAFYDPAVTTVVFVFLPSKTGNSVAMWRRRIGVGNNTRTARINEIHLAMAGLRREKDYVVHVDEIPGVKPVEDKKKKTVGIAGEKKHPAFDHDYGYFPHEYYDQKPKKRKWWQFLC